MENCKLGKARSGTGTISKLRQFKRAHMHRCFNPIPYLHSKSVANSLSLFSPLVSSSSSLCDANNEHSTSKIEFYSVLCYRSLATMGKQKLSTWDSVLFFGLFVPFPSLHHFIALHATRLAQHSKFPRVLYKTCGVGKLKGISKSIISCFCSNYRDSSKG